MRRWNKRRVNGPYNMSGKGRGRGKNRRHRRGTDGLREVTEEAALMGLMMLAGRRLLLAGHAAGSPHRTVWRPAGSIGPHGEAARARREKLHQESQQENWKHQFTPLPQNFLPSLT